ncbi:hypothetical protein HK102_013919 [Quaeritorhiza haematococci]|nr:hypothetical protein HK102_013919 [Quaeritorhiza haematococci]
MSDPFLSGLTHIIVDEVHERDLLTDVALLMLKNVGDRRRDLKVVLMSATVDTDKLARYFGEDTPIIQVPGLTYPIEEYFLNDIIGITRFRPTATELEKYDVAFDSDFRMPTLPCALIADWETRLLVETLCTIYEHQILTMSESKPDSFAVLVFLPGWNEIMTVKKKIESHPLLGRPGVALILPLHSSISAEEQKTVLKPHNGRWKIILATSIAETSITIEDVVFVIDLGRHKQKKQQAHSHKSMSIPKLAQAEFVPANVTNYILETSKNKLSSCMIFRKSSGKGATGTIIHSVAGLIVFLELSLAAISLSPLSSSPTSGETLIILGSILARLPITARLGKLLLCLDPILTIAASISIGRDFLLMARTPVERISVLNSRQHFLHAADQYFSGGCPMSAGVVETQSPKAKEIPPTTVIEGAPSDHLPLLVAFNTWSRFADGDVEKKRCDDLSLILAVVAAAAYPFLARRVMEQRMTTGQKRKGPNGDNNGLQKKQRTTVHASAPSNHQSTGSSITNTNSVVAGTLSPQSTNFGNTSFGSSTLTPGRIDCLVPYTNIPVKVRRSSLLDIQSLTNPQWLSYYQLDRDGMKTSYQVMLEQKEWMVQKVGVLNSTDAMNIVGEKGEKGEEKKPLSAFGNVRGVKPKPVQMFLGGASWASDWSVILLSGLLEDTEMTSMAEARIIDGKNACDEESEPLVVLGFGMHLMFKMRVSVADAIMRFRRSFRSTRNAWLVASTGMRVRGAGTGVLTNLALIEEERMLLIGVVRKVLGEELSAGTGGSAGLAALA